MSANPVYDNSRRGQTKARVQSMVDLSVHYNMDVGDEVGMCDREHVAQCHITRNHVCSSWQPLKLMLALSGTARGNARRLYLMRRQSSYSYIVSPNQSSVICFKDKDL